MRDVGRFRRFRKGKGATATISGAVHTRERRTRPKARCDIAGTVSSARPKTARTAGLSWRRKSPPRSSAGCSHLGAERRMSPKTLEAYQRDVLQFLAFPRRASRRRAVAEGACRAGAGRCARLHGGAPRRRHRQPLADAHARRHARLRALSRAQRQGQGRRARRRARAEDRQDPAAAARGRRRQARGRSRYRRRRRARAVDSRARRRGARPALRLRLAHLRSARA